jgi:PAS domain S-box-containing protein
MATLDDYQWLFRKAPAMAASISEDGCFLDVNDAMLDRLGYEREEMVGRYPADFATEETARRIEKEIRPALRRLGKIENKPVGLVARNGEVVDCRTDAFVEFDGDGRFVRTVAMYSEFSDQARANLKYRALYRATPAMLHTVDGDGHILTVTDHWLHKLGYEREAVVGRNIVDFFSTADRKKYGGGRLREFISKGGFDNIDRQMVARDGQVIDLVQSAIADHDEAGNVQRLFVASKDVTKRNRAERELRRALAENARLREELERERDYLREEVNVAMQFGRIIGKSAALKRMLERVKAVAETPASVLLQGESGVGKELVAREIHARSPRAEKPLVKVNCASIPQELFESEFFGHVKGAFTGAHRDRVGRFQLADGGTIFLDEVGEIPLELQSKLLRVLQESEFEKVGDDITKSVDVRVIAATNRNLEELIVEGRFREDLFYRLSVFPVDIPPLRERADDVIQLAQYFLEQTCQDFGREPLTLTKTQAQKLREYDWPGNVRELKNVIERAVILSTGRVLRLDLSMPELQLPATGSDPEPAGFDHGILTEDDLRELQRKNLVKALEQTDWRVSGKGGAAEILGVKPTTLADRVRAFGIEKPLKRNKAGS